MRDSTPFNAKVHSSPFVWTVPGYPAVTLLERAMDGIAADVLDVFARVPRRGAETGGVLLGRRSRESVVVEGFVPVPSEHRFGRLYRLSDADRKSLREALEAANGGRGGLEAVGLYRSNAREEFASTAEDAETQSAHFAEHERLLLLIQPSLSRPSEADLFFWREGGLQPAFRRLEFPFRAMTADLVGGKSYVPALREQPPPAVELPPHHRVEPPQPFMEAAVAAGGYAIAPAQIRQTAPERPRGSEPAGSPVLSSDRSGREDAFSPRWLGWGVAAALLLAAGVVGVRYDLRGRPAPAAAVPSPEPSASAPESQPVAAPSGSTTPAPASAVADLPVPTPVKPAPEPASVASAHETTPVLQSRDRESAEPSPGDVRTLLDRWSAAIRRGDIEAASAYYAPQAREHARQSMRDLLRRQSRMDVFRLSNVAITQQQRGEAVASFQERWQSGGSLKFAGEQRVRLVLRRTGERWQIASEEAQEIWTQQAQ